MVMGPCGGVRADGSCEVIPYPCVFDVPAEWADPVPCEHGPGQPADWTALAAVSISWATSAGIGVLARRAMKCCGG